MIEIRKFEQLLMAVQNASFRCGEHDPLVPDEDPFEEVYAKARSAENELRNYVLQAAGCLTHPQGIEIAPYLAGRWMVTGPDFEDGTGWSLCLHENQKCQRCVATFSYQDDAEHAARVHDKADQAEAADRAETPTEVTHRPPICPLIPPGQDQ